MHHHRHSDSIGSFFEAMNSINYAGVNISYRASTGPVTLFFYYFTFDQKTAVFFLKDRDLASLLKSMYKDNSLPSLSSRLK